MEISSSSQAYSVCGSVYAWLPFFFFVLFSLVFSIIYVFYFWKRHEKDCFAAVVSVLALFITLISVFLLPVDVFLVSYMKNSDGTFKDWVSNMTIKGVEQNISYAYYGFYSAIIALAFFILPLAYFAFEENDEERDFSFRILSALRYTSVFFLFAVIFIIIGAFLPYERFHVPRNETENLTSWEQIEYIFNQLDETRGINALSFVLSLLIIAGMLGIVVYTSVGLSSFTIGNIRGWRRISEDIEVINEKKQTLERRIKQFRAKEDSVLLSARDLQSLHSMEEELQYTIRVQRKLSAPSNPCLKCCNDICLARGFTIIVGMFGACFGILLWVSLFIVNVEKALRSFGYQSGYFIENLKWFNPMNFVMTQMSRIFPLDYVFYFCMIIFLILCTVSGLRHTGIWCFCVRMFKVRPQNTQPQGLIMLCGILIYVVLALNVLMYEVMPQYTTFGNQHYRFMPENATNVTQVKVLPCNFEAPQGQCIMSRVSAFILSYTVKTYFFSTAYYYFTWLFLVAVVLGFFVVMCSRKKSLIDEKIDEDDFDDSDDDDKPLVP